MKFLYTTDTHFRHDRPKYRIDDIYKSQFEELSEISTLVIEHDVDYILHGGDFFHTPRPSHELVRDLIGWGKYVGVPILVLPGNHDLIGYSQASISSVGLGVLFESGVFQEMLPSNIWEEEKIYVRGVLPEVAIHNDKYMIDAKYDDYTKIIVSHNYVSPTPLRFPYLPVNEVKTNADLFLLGHLHDSSDITNGKTRFINPGALSRWAVNEANRIPTVLLIEIQGKRIDIKHIVLETAKRGYEIFDIKTIVENKGKVDQLKNFMDSLENTNFETCDIEQLVLIAGKDQGMEEKILNKSLEKIREAKANLG